MTQAGHTFRLFVSSTFSDLKEERNALHRTVFPALKSLCEENGFRFQAIDLRWGIREEAGLDQQTMRICLDEVKRCQEVTPKPNFLILLGDRYGWRPLPSEIPADEWRRIEKQLDAQGQEGARRLQQLREWYHLDLNARPRAEPPGTWLLKPRTDPPFNDPRVWESEVERPLREILIAATTGMNLADEAQLKYWASATEQEIARGALGIEDAADHIFCFSRAIEGLPADGAAQGFRDLVLATSRTGEVARLVPDNETESLLEELKGPGGKLRKKLPGSNLFDYKASWLLSTGERAVEDQSPVSLDHVDQLCEDVQRVLGTVMRAQIADLKEANRQATDLDRELEQHEEFCKDRTRFFSGRAETLQGISAYLTGDERRPLGLIGEPGSGKSAVLAKAVEQARASYPDAAVVFRFIGWTAGSAGARDLLDKLCQQLSQLTGAGDQTPSDYRELLQEFPKRLEQAGKTKKVLVILDGLDQLSDADNARSLNWLPMELPANVRLVVSTSTEPGDTRGVLERRLPAECRLTLDDMPVAEAHEVLGTWFDATDRTLRGRAPTPERCDGQWKCVLDQFSGCRRPLFLKLAFEEARRWRSFDAPTDNTLAPDISSLIEQLFNRLSLPASHGPTIVARSLGYLVAGKNGLTEDELIDVLSTDEQVLGEVRRFHRPPQEKLPVVIWSRLYFDLEPYLTQRRADDTTLFGFYHRQLDLVARAKFLEPYAAERHRKLAEFFGAQSVFRGEGATRTGNVRKLSELPYQLTYGGDRANSDDEVWAKLHATLTDLEFLEAKCTYVGISSEGSGEGARKVYNGVYELQEDYRRALQVFPAD